MSPVAAPQIAAAKVIAAGALDKDWLRATVMLTPFYAAESAESLAHWPSQLISWLRESEFRLSLLIQPVSYVSSGDCVALPAATVPTIAAEASAMEATWQGRAAPTWVDDLWADAFGAAKDRNTWLLLARLIAMSSTGTALASGKAGMATNDPDPNITSDKVRSKLVSGNGESVNLEWILPSRQTELSLLLEYKRALELCDTAVHSLDQRRDALEVDCSKMAQRRPGDPEQAPPVLQLKELFTAARVQYKDAHEVVQNLYSEKPCGPRTVQTSPGTRPESIGASQRIDIEKELHDPLDSYVAANQPQKFGDGKEIPSSRADALNQIFYSLQSSPTLSRLFGLSVDVRFRGDSLRSILRDHPKVTDGSNFLYLALKDGSLCRNALSCTVYTFAKYRPHSVSPHFWPASRGEVGLGRTPDPDRLFDLPQYDGVIVAGQRLNTAQGPVSRFELSSLDVHSASEAALDRRSANLTDEELRRQCAAASPALRPAAIARKTYLTAGVVILDRGRQQQAVSQFAARIAHQQRVQTMPLVLDAEDLTIGYRIDVGVPLRGETPSYAWRGLMARNVTYGIKGLHAQRVRAVSTRLFLEDRTRNTVDPDSGWRQCLEDGLLALPARLMPRTDAAGDDGPVDAYVEEAIGTWAGEPMAVPCGGTRDTRVKELYGLPAGCVVRAPTSQKDPHRRIPPLRFGWPYRFGLRPVYSGGISLPLELARNLYDLDRLAGFPLGGTLTIPSVPAPPRKTGEQPSSQPAPIRRRDQLRRFLRHERIDAPFMLLPETLALHRNGQMGYERAAHAVIRTTRASARDRGIPTVTQRIFVAPSVSQSFAAMHGVFDNTSEQHPAQGLSSPRFGRSGVRYDATNGGFPVATSEHIVGFNGVPYPSSRHISIHATQEGMSTGDLVYSTAPPRGPRKTPYYPDPACLQWIIAVRVAGSSTYLNGGPCVISAYGKGYEYPHARPLVITVMRTQAKQRSGIPNLEDILSWPKPGSNGRLNGVPLGNARTPGAVEALLSLAPGEDMEVDVWCVPEEIELTRRFAVVESVGALAIARARSKNKQGDNNPPTREQLCEELKGLLPALVCDVADKCLSSSGVSGEALRDWTEGCGGPGGLPAPGPESLRAIGRALYEAAIRRPLDEIAAVRTLRVTHALDQPLRQPEFSRSPAVTAEARSTAEPVITLYRTSASDESDGDASQHEPERYSATGDLLIHLPTTGCVEISAKMVSPSSDRFDDLRRALSIRDRRHGTWPRLANGSLVPASQIFGFDVSPSGDVSLPKTEVVLYRLDDIPLPGVSTPLDTKDGMYRIPLRELFSLRGRKPTLGTGKPTFQFSDGLARLLHLRVTAYARHGDQMRTASAPARDGRWLRDGQPLPASASRTSTFVPTWLPAAVRPAEPVTRTPVPAFLWTMDNEKSGAGGTRRELTRRMVIRIPLARPWFSSGEEERLGLVLWPPNLFDQDAGQFSNDVIEVDGTGSANKRLMNVDDFRDEDLGPGGKFITRWGGDPIRTQSSNGDRHTFVPASAFLDALEDIGTGFKAELVTNVVMPIRVSDDGGHADGGDAPERTLNVSLLTYQPKFDVNDEQWYVDVAIEHEREAEPFVRLGLVRYQPHAPAHLQVSHPVVQWTQLLPRRTVQVRRSKANVQVRVEGLAAFPRTVAAVGPDDERAAIPRMIARIIRESKLETGVSIRRVMTEAMFDADHVTYVSEQEGFRAVWERQMPLDLDKHQDDRDRPKYFVFLEEREARLPATYPSEPVSPEMAMGRDCNGEFLNDVLVQSGARFVARIPL